MMNRKEMINQSYGQMPLNQSIIQGSSDVSTFPVEITFRDEAKLLKCAKENAVVGSSN